MRGGGHNVAGRAVTEGGLMIDLAEMKGIEVDPEARTARAEGGVNWNEFNAATAEHGLAVTGGAISTTGIAGLTLGGGLGWLMGVQGFAADNLLSVELVTASGEVLDVTQESHPDLFWALRGGGGNFGVATSFEYRLHPVGQVVGGLAVHPFDGRRKRCLAFYRDFTRSLPDELTVFAALAHAPDGSGAKIAAVAVCHVGATGAGRGRHRARAGLRRARDGRDRADALSGDEHPARRRLPEGRAQLLEGELRGDVRRRPDRRRRRAVRGRRRLR